ncbi:MAG: hypothetical protein HY941_01185 [Gammaproteobacteria bacterium]|nr:hypothetical protein [Gammaproteobacteria bacterium]
MNAKSEQSNPQSNPQSNQEAPREHPAMGQIVGYLKDYPFLLITIAGLLILSGILIFDLEKLKEFKWLIYGVVLVPLVIQFFIEYQKIAARRAAERGVTAAPPAGAVPTPAPMPIPVPASALPVSTKALWSLALLIMILLALNETSAEEFHDSDLMLGYLVFAGTAGVLAWLALGDVKQQRARGKVLAVTNLVFATLVALSAIGWLMEVDPVPMTPSADVQSIEQPQIWTAQTSKSSENTVAAAAAPPVSNAALANAAPAAVALAGQYILRDFTVGGMPIPLNGALSISRASSDTYQWQAHYAGQGFEGVQTESSNGQFIRRNGLWYQRVTQSDAVDWEDTGEIPMLMAHDGANLQLRYSNDGTEIVTTWQRDVE